MYDLIWEPDGVHKCFSGMVSAREFIESVVKVQGDPRFDDAHYIINDLSGITGQELSEKALTEVLAKNIGAYASNPNCLIVYVTTDAELAERIKSILSPPDIASYRVEVCPTVSDARDWLDNQPRSYVMSNVMGFRLM